MIAPVLRRVRSIFTRLLFVAAAGAAASAAATVSLQASTGTVPLSGVVGTSYSGSFQCRNSGTEDVTKVTCSVAGLPSWATQGACSPAVPVASLPAAPPGLAGYFDTIRCPVTGTPTSTGIFTLTVTAVGDGANNVNTRSVHIFSTPTALEVSLDLPPALAGQTYSGSVVCSTVGTTAPTNWACGVSGLPSWSTKSCFPPSPTVIICIIGGTPNAVGSSTVTLTSTADNAATASTMGTLRVTSRLCDLDITGQGLLNPATDGLLLMRRLLGLSGQPLVDGIGTSLVYSATELQRFIDRRKYTGLEPHPTALVSGQIVLRLLQSVADDQLLVGTALPPSATLVTAASVRADVNAKCGTNF
jgi:hypothetical protein